MADGELSSVFLGEIPYLEGRRIQGEFIARRRAGEAGDTFLFCEHPPTITLGRRALATDLQLSEAELRTAGIEVFPVDRAGGATYHGPGQLVIYPVVDLHKRRIGVRRFVAFFLEALVSFLQSKGVAAQASLERPGVWVNGAKIASAGLRIRQGLTDHGFSLNVCGDLRIFQKFVPCGMKDLRVTSLEGEGVGGTVKGIAQEAARHLSREFAKL